MNFDMGAEQAEEEDDITVKTVLVTDDVVSSENIPDRRGIAGDFFVFKVAGAKAATGADPDEVAAAAEKANAYTRSMGVAMSAATLPAKGDTIFEMEDGDMEIGMGQHGEGGGGRQPMKTAKETVEIMANALVKDIPLQAGDEAFVMINGSGATTLMEMYILYKDCVKYLESLGIKVVANMVGEILTVQEQAGFQLNLAKWNDEFKALWAEPARTIAFYK